MQLNAIESVAYEPKKLVITLAGQVIKGCPSTEPVHIHRGLNGVANATVFLWATSEHVLSLKRALGKVCMLEVDYLSDNILSNNLCFRSEMLLEGFSTKHSVETPILAFHFTNKGIK